MDRSPSARLHPSELQVQTRGPGFLASPILATGFHQGRQSQATGFDQGWLVPEVSEPGEAHIGTILSRQAGASTCASHAQWSQQQHFPNGLILLPWIPQAQQKQSSRILDQSLWSVARSNCFQARSSHTCCGTNSMPANGLSSGAGRFRLAKIHLRCRTSFSSRVSPGTGTRSVLALCHGDPGGSSDCWACSGGRPAKPSPEAAPTLKRNGLP
eukprot:4539890-Amphidinium_carterae.1